MFYTYKEAAILITGVTSPRDSHGLRNGPRIYLDFIRIFIRGNCGLGNVIRIIQPNSHHCPTLRTPLLGVARKLFPVHDVFIIRIRTIRPVITPDCQLGPNAARTTRVTTTVRACNIRPRGTIPSTVNRSTERTP